MTGMGADGLEGVKRVRARGGWCIAQDQASCAVYGMPRSVIEAGQADEVVALDELPARIAEIARAK
jgi:two-component system chemotaxis response regulator CheB